MNKIILFFARMNDDQKESVNILTKLLVDKDKNVRWCASVALRKLRERFEFDINKILHPRFSIEESNTTKITIIAGLKPDSDVVINLVKSEVKNESTDPLVRLAALKWLFDHRIKESIPLFIDILENASAFLRRFQAAQFISQWNGFPDREKIIKEFLLKGGLTDHKKRELLSNLQN